MAIKVGNNYYEAGTRVVVENIDDPHDVDLNGRMGTLHRPFVTFLDGFPDAVAGIRLEPDNTRPHWYWPDRVDPETGRYIIGCREESIVVRRGEFRVVEPGNSL